MINDGEKMGHAKFKHASKFRFFDFQNFPLF